VLPGGQVAWVMRPVPGLILYEITKMELDPDPLLHGAPSYDELSRGVWSYLLAVVGGAMLGVLLVLAIKPVLAGVGIGALIKAVGAGGLVGAGAAAG
jgi:hypothetical protein